MNLDDPGDTTGISHPEIRRPEPIPPFKPYESTEAMRVCMDQHLWQIWFWDGETRCPAGHPNMLEVDGNNDGYAWCADVVDDSYGPLDWFRLEPCDPPDGAPS